ncbi:prepilin peptidase [Pseudonocardia sichuanensis]|uniref:prepilin peptidase n=1 Tax=Pseudonocardia kunmingensis TaxID=630975 RepID=UPI001478E6FD|nr:prepilin peptidase [Pseudonocardia kunmingensis]
MTSALTVALLWGVGGAAAGAVVAAVVTPRLLNHEPPPSRTRLLAGCAAATGLALALLAARFVGIELLAFSCVAAIGIAASAIDLIERRLPSQVLLPCYTLLIGLLLIEAVRTAAPGSFTRAVSAGSAVAGVYLAVALASRGGLGAGDVKLGGLLGIALGWQGWPVVLAGILLAWTAAATTVLIRRRASSVADATIPMGPFLVIGAVLALTTVS